MATPLPVYVVHSFTDSPFAGNPAGVLLCGRIHLQVIDDRVHLSDHAVTVLEGTLLV